uniref:Uncharacterized protein n=1 Tax=Myoviridae sp. ct3it16 TaxID=2825027 RepID=A0A8S5PGZ6_9CAUD|nr:MAG TPA: hypothetical protein [Myoviridae sp. ct3it16]
MSLSFFLLCSYSACVKAVFREILNNFLSYLLY